MSDQELQHIASCAEMVIAGYSFTKEKNFISVLNLNDPRREMVLSFDGKMLETNMDPLEQVLVLRYWEKNSSFLEDEDA